MIVAVRRPLSKVLDNDPDEFIGVISIYEEFAIGFHCGNCSTLNYDSYYGVTIGLSSPLLLISASCVFPASYL